MDRENAEANVQLKPHKLNEPYKLKEPSRIFVYSMSDLFHPQIPDNYIAQVFQVMDDLPQHIFQILTKRPRRAAKYPGPWTSNIWQGTSVESKKSSIELTNSVNAKRKHGSYLLNPYWNLSVK